MAIQTASETLPRYTRILPCLPQTREHTHKHTFNTTHIHFTHTQTA